VFSKDVTPDGADRVKAAGPFFEAKSTTNGLTFTALRPFYGVTGDVPNDRVLKELLWPLAINKEFLGETYWQMLFTYGHDFDSDQPDSRYRTLLLPLLFWGRDVNKEKYFALFPAGGKINEFLGQDKIVFVLFPLYFYHSVNGVETTNLLWPVCSRTTGKDIDKFRIFPFYMRSDVGDRFSNRSILWPVWTSFEKNFPTDKGSGFVFFPFYGHASLTSQETWMYLPPLFRYSKSEKDGVSGNFPWPFIQYSAANPSKFYIWPLWGYKHMPEIKTSFFLWPIGHAETIVRPEYSINRFSILPVSYYESRIVTNVAENCGNDDVVARYFKLWPLVSYQRDGDTYRFKMLDLWPLKETGGIERNWAPLWTLYSHVRVGHNSEDELLWGMYRRSNCGPGTRKWSLFPLFSYGTGQVCEDSSEWSLLMGLIGRKREGLLKKYRLLYFLEFETKEEE